MSSGEITSIIYPPFRITPGQVLHDGTTVVETTEEITCNNHYYNGSAFVEKPERPSRFHDWDWDHKDWRNHVKNLWVAIRRERDQRLGSCDWTQLADSPLSDEDKANWAMYRDQLRNFPQWNSSATDWDSLNWPVPPNEWV